MKIQKNCNVTGTLETSDHIVTIIQSLVDRGKDAIAGSFRDDTGTVGNIHVIKR